MELWILDQGHPSWRFWNCFGDMLVRSHWLLYDIPCSMLSWLCPIYIYVYVYCLYIYMNIYKHTHASEMYLCIPFIISHICWYSIKKTIKHAVKSNDIRMKWFNPQCSTSVSLSNCLNAYHTYPGISQETYILGLRPTIFSHKTS